MLGVFWCFVLVTMDTWNVDIVICIGLCWVVGVDVSWKWMVVNGIE